MSNGTTAVFSGRRYATAQTSLYQWDYGQLLIISGLDLPSPFECHFANEGDTETITMLGYDNAVTIPDQFLTSGKSINAYIYLHEGEDDGETEYKIVIPVLTRPQPSDIEPTPEQQTVIDQLLAELRSAVASLNAAVEYIQSIEDDITTVSVDNDKLVFHRRGQA